MNGYLSVKGWSNFQHYKDRNPPWIKLHRELLNDYEFTCLQDASKAHLMLIWLLASQLENKIPNDAEWIKNRIACKETINLKELIDNGFLLPDSNALAECKQSAIVETETEAYREEAEREKPQRKKRATSLTAEWMLPDDYREYCKSKRPDLCPDATAENFLDYYLSHGKPMVDWKRTWQRWVRNEHGTSRKAGNGTSNQVISTPAGRGKEALERVRRKDNEAALAADA